jgi:imidazolonepropionase-like amidohydrolase
VLDNVRLVSHLRNEDAVRLCKQIAKAKPADCMRLRGDFAQLLANGVTVLAGTDAHNPSTAPGASLHGELEVLGESGMTPIQALRAATSAPAAVLNWRDRGRIAEGMRADMILVEGDPTAGISATRNIRGVCKSGIAFDREARRQHVAAMATTPTNTH